MAIKKLTSSGRYQIDFRDRDGVRQRQSFDTKREAQVVLEQIRTDLRAGTYIAPKQSPRFGEVAEEWLRAKRAGCRPISCEGWRTHLDRHLLPRLGTRRLNEIDVVVLEKMRDDLRASGLSPQTTNKLLMTTSAVFKLALRHNYCANNPAAIAERARAVSKEFLTDVENVVSEDEVLSPDEIRRLLDAAEPGSCRTLFLTAALTGMRSGELYGLRWEDVDFEGRRINVCRAMTRSRGSDGKWAPHFFPPKSKAGRRSIPMAPQLVSALRAWKLACPPNQFNLVFPSPTLAPMHHSVVRMYGLMPALKRAKLRHVGMHSLRHSFASALIAKGKPITEIQHLLGHADPTVTLRVHSHWFKRTETDSVNQLADLVTGQNGHFVDTMESESVDQGDGQSVQNPSLRMVK